MISSSRKSTDLSQHHLSSACKDTGNLLDIMREQFKEVRGQQMTRKDGMPVYSLQYVMSAVQYPRQHSFLWEDLSNFQTNLEFPWKHWLELLPDFTLHPAGGLFGNKDVEKALAESQHDMKSRIILQQILYWNECPRRDGAEQCWPMATVLPGHLPHGLGPLARDRVHPRLDSWKNRLCQPRCELTSRGQNSSAGFTSHNKVTKLGVLVLEQ